MIAKGIVVFYAASRNGRQLSEHRTASVIQSLLGSSHMIRIFTCGVFSGTSKQMQPSMCRSNRRTGRRKAMSCLTCKVRKVKCDEERPACHQCIATGRRCEGYGVWANFSKEDAPPAESLVPRPAKSLPSSCLANSTEQDRMYFEWYKTRTAVKIPGAFKLTFWEQLVLQATASEPAVLHAVLTLSAVHKRAVENKDRMQTIPDAQEQFMLQHYSKSIQHLQPHFLSKDKPSVRVALITCVIFVSLEFLRGRFKTALAHFRNGMSVFRELQPSVTEVEGLPMRKPWSCDTMDDWIYEQFSRLNTTVELFQHTYSHSCEILWLRQTVTYHVKFKSIREAWFPLERLLNEIIFLKEQDRQGCKSSEAWLALRNGRYQIQEELRHWKHTYEVLSKHLHASETSGQVLRLFRIYHTMATIMVEACLSGDDETVFDGLTQQFVTLIKIAIEMWKCGSNYLSAPTSMFGSQLNMSRSIVDIGWIPPLYYTALKCRIHRLRYHAIRLIETASHREAIWDSQICATVAHKVMEIEEQDLEKCSEHNGIDLAVCPNPEELPPISVTPYYRINEVQVDLPDEPQNQISIFYRRGQRSDKWEQSWVSIVE